MTARNDKFLITIAGAQTAKAALQIVANATENAVGGLTVVAGQIWITNPFQGNAVGSLSVDAFPTQFADTQQNAVGTLTTGKTPLLMTPGLGFGAGLGNIVSKSRSFSNFYNTKNEAFGPYQCAAAEAFFHGDPDPLTLRWTFDTADISGPTITDRGMGSHTGTIHGTVSQVSGVFGDTALSFDGSTNYVSTTAVSELLNTTGQSDPSLGYDTIVSFWIKDLRTSGSGDQYIAHAVGPNPSESGSTDGFHEFRVFYDTTNHRINIRRGRQGSPGYSFNQTFNWTPSAGTWYHLTCTCSSGFGDVRLYINGVKQTGNGLTNSQGYSSGHANWKFGSQFVVGGYIDWANTFGQGAFAVAGNWLTATLDDFRVYTKTSAADRTDFVSIPDGYPLTSNYTVATQYFELDLTAAGVGSLSSSALLTAVARASMPGVGGLTCDAFVAKFANATLSGVGSTNVTANLLLDGNVTVGSGEGSLTVDAFATQFASATMDGEGSLSTRASLIETASAVLGGVGGIFDDISVPEIFASAELPGEGALDADATVKQGSIEPVTLSGEGAITVDALVIKWATASLSGEGSLTTAAEARIVARQQTSAVGTLFSEADVLRFARAGLNALGSLSVDATIEEAASVTMSAAGSMSVNAAVIRAARAALDAAGGMIARANLRANASAQLDAQGSLSADAIAGLKFASATMHASSGLVCVAQVIVHSAAHMAADASLDTFAERITFAHAHMAAAGTLSGIASRLTPASITMSGIGNVHCPPVLTITAHVEMDAFGDVSAIAFSGKASKPIISVDGGEDDDSLTGGEDPHSLSGGRSTTEVGGNDQSVKTIKGGRNTVTVKAA